MKIQNRLKRGFALLVLLGFSGLWITGFAQDEDSSRRFWPPNFRPTATKPAATARTGRYKRTTPAIEREAIPTAVEKDAVVGITIWRLRPTEDVEKEKGDNKDKDAARILVVRKGKKSSLTPERVEASTAFTTGQMLRLSIEIPRSGYLYVIDREQYEDGSFSEPYLVFPVDPDKDDNKVEAGRVIEIPGGTDEPFFEVQPLKGDNTKSQTAESLTVLVTPEQLDKLPRPVRNDQGNYEPMQLSNSEVQRWEKMWATQVEQLELEGGAGQVYTRSEQAAGADKKKRLTQDDPLPQTLFRVATKPGKPLLVKLPLKIAK